MNIVFWVGVLLFLFLIWLCASCIFRDIGEIFGGLWEDAMDEMKSDTIDSDDKLEEDE